MRVGPFVYSILVVSALFAGLFYGGLPLVAASEGTIDPVNKYAWGENVGWINFGTAEGNVFVGESELTGYAWGENIGWISLNCSNTDSCGVVDYKVANDGEGNLSGHAWGENVGWIVFDPSNGGVSIDGNGDFAGYAWGENIGWISFNCSNTDSCGTVDYKVSLGTSGDSGQISISANISESLTFAIEGVADTDCENNVMDGAGNHITTTPSSVPFGTTFSNTFSTGCLELEVTTNAPDGYTVTVEKNQPLTSGIHAIDDGDCDGSCSTTAAGAWDTPANNGFAYCMRDSLGEAAETVGWTIATQCGGASQSFKLFPTTGTNNPESIMEKGGSTIGDISNTGYRISIPPEQEPGTYAATITYIATPNFYSRCSRRSIVHLSTFRLGDTHSRAGRKFPPIIY